MKRFYSLSIIGLLLLLLGVSSGYAYQVINMIDNCSFELCLSNNNVPYGWRFYTNEGSTFVWGSSPLSNIKNVYCNRTSTTGDTVLDNWDHMVPVSPGIGYKFQFAAKGSGQLKATIGWRDASHNVISETSHFYNLTGSYVEHTIQASSPNGAAESWIAFRLNGTGYFYVDDVRQWINSYTEYDTTGYTNLSYCNTPNGNLNMGLASDGYTGHDWVWGKLYRKTLNASNGHYMYFDVADSFIHGGTNKVAIVVEYGDVGSDNLEVHYDSTGGGAYKSAGVITKTGSLQWKHAVFYVEDAYFNDRQNNSTDWRIYDCGDGAEFISYVAVYRWQGARIKDNHLEINGSSTFLKIGSLPGNYATTDYSYVVDQLDSKDYTAMKLDTYWRDFDSGATYSALTYVNNVINACYNNGMDACIAFERYNVGGAATPEYILDWYDSQAYNSSLDPVVDDEYGTYAKVPSYHNAAYNNRGRAWMNWLLFSVDKSKILWYEPAIEPQYIGTQLIDYSGDAHTAWRIHLAERYTLSYLNNAWGTSYSRYDNILMPTNFSHGLNGTCGLIGVPQPWLRMSTTTFRPFVMSLASRLLLQVTC